MLVLRSCSDVTNCCKVGDKLPYGFGIGLWLYVQHNQLQRQRLEGVRNGAIDDAAPGWRSTITLSPESLHKRSNATEIKREDRFTASLKEAEALVAELGRLPRFSAMGTYND